MPNDRPIPRRRLVERLRRKPDFEPDAGFTTAVRLANGEEWHLTRPWLEVVPIFRAGRPVDSARLLTCGPALDLLIESISASEPGVDGILSVMALGAFLLAPNYDLADDEMSRLFIYRPGEAASDEMITAIVDVAVGGSRRPFAGGALADPKPCAAG